MVCISMCCHRMTERASKKISKKGEKQVKTEAKKAEKKNPKKLKINQKTKPNLNTHTITQNSRDLQKHFKKKTNLNPKTQ